MREMLAPGVWSDNVPSSAIARPGSYRTLGGSIVTARKAPSLGIQTPGERARMQRKNAKVRAASLTATDSASRIIGVSSNDDPEAQP